MSANLKPLDDYPDWFSIETPPTPADIKKGVKYLHDAGLSGLFVTRQPSPPIVDPAAAEKGERAFLEARTLGWTHA